MDEDFIKKPRQNILDDGPAIAKPVPRPKPEPEEDYVALLHPRMRAEPTARPQENTVNNDESFEQPDSSAVALASKSLLVIVAIVILVIVIVVGLFLFLHNKSNKPDVSKTLGSSTAVGDKLVTIAVYYPNNLPPGYTFNNDAKILKTDVLYYSITGPKKELYYVTQQSIPANFDFVAFNKKFSNPDNFSTTAGTATAGPVGANLLGSIRTNKNTWIIINSSSGTPLTGLESVIRSLDVK